MTSRAKSAKQARKTLKRELEHYRDQGIPLLLDGMPSTPKNIAKACQVAEGGVYMRDYAEDESGHIACVNFDFVEDE